MNSNILNKLSFLSLTIVVVLLPIFFLPFTSIPVEAAKGLFLVVGLIASVIFWTIARFSDGKIDLPRSVPILAGGGVLVATLLSTLFSKSLGLSAFGAMLDIGSFWFLFAGILLMLMSAIIFKDQKKAQFLLFGTVASAAIVLVFQALHIFLPKILSLGVLVNNTDNILGSWNAFGIFAGFFVVAALFIFEFYPINRNLRVALSVLTVFAVLLIAVVNFVFVWEIVGVFALLLFVYKISINASQKEQAHKVEFPIFSFAIILAALFFFMSSGFIGGILPSKLKISNNEVSPSFISTLSVTKSVIKSNPIFGLGPNKFGDAWALYKPTVINGTQFWDVSFNSGSGLLPTLMATTGILGILAWLAFLVLFIFSGIRWLFFSLKANANLESIPFFFLALYLLCSAFFYLTGTVLFLLAFVFAGVFIGLVSSTRKNGEISILFLNDHRKSFFSMLLLIIVMIVSAAVGFKYIQKFASVPYFTKTLGAASIDEAETSIKKALLLHSNDLYLRTYSQVYLLKFNSIVVNGGQNLSDADKASLQTSLDQAVNASQLAVNYDSKNYLNYQMLGSIYQTAGYVGVKDGYVQALEAYTKASELNPANPRLKLAMASISSAQNDTKQAKAYANQALTLKPDYIDALLALSQIAKSEGNLSEAISYAEKALALSPGNKDLIKYVDSLRGGYTIPTPETTPKNQ